MLPQITKGIGVDLLHLPRLTRLLTKRPTYTHRFARRILTKSEYRQFLKSTTTTTTTTTTSSSSSPLAATTIKWLGVRWAAKEAAFKAFGTRRGGLVWEDVEVGYYDSGQPFLWLFNKERERRMGGLSISHDGEYLVAMAMI
ncbi:4'-phosphopantetheinyl transferase superfamily [Tuber borchii]|uniref:4'-phosphopantetheinyl transferase superfamily n=1 Tax=Tuber borchii TaxID=42251 RepID=A0A2T7A7W7_TUBBO|nr:4'-phosphopantetheinyl transferase superfamily [Tuber borchii]